MNRFGMQIKKEKTNLTVFSDIAFDMLNTDSIHSIHLLEPMLVALMDELKLECSDIDAFMDKINSQAAGNNRTYFNSIVNEFISNKLPF